MTESGEFVVVDDGPEPITDIKILSKKENKHKDFELVSLMSRGRVYFVRVIEFIKDIINF